MADYWLLEHIRRAKVYGVKSNPVGPAPPRSELSGYCGWVPEMRGRTGRPRDCRTFEILCVPPPLFRLFAL